MASCAHPARRLLGGRDEAIGGKSMNAGTKVQKDHDKSYPTVRLVKGGALHVEQNTARTVCGLVTCAGDARGWMRATAKLCKSCDRMKDAETMKLREE
jgi:hypothetical protein